MEPRRRFLAGTIRANADHVALPAEPADAPTIELLDAPPVECVNVLATLVEPEPEVTPAGRPRRVTQVPRHLSAEGDSPITAPNRRFRVQTRVASYPTITVSSHSNTNTFCIFEGCDCLLSR